MSEATILFTCEACGVRGRVPDSFRGKTARCPSCKHVQVIPIDAPSPPPSGKTERIAQPTITRSFANPQSGTVKDETRSRAILGIIERLEELEQRLDRLNGSLQRLQTRSNAGDENVEGRIAQLQQNLTQTQHAVTGLHHMETRLEAMGKKLDVLSRSQARQENDQAMDDLYGQIKRLDRLITGAGLQTGSHSIPDNTAIDDLAERISNLEAKRLDTSAGPGDEATADSADYDVLAEEISSLKDEVAELQASLQQTRHTAPSTANGEEAANYQQVLIQLQDDVETLREQLAAIPGNPDGDLANLQHTVNDLQQTVAHAGDGKQKGSPLLAILAIVVALVAAGLGGAALWQGQQTGVTLSDLQKQLDGKGAIQDRLLQRMQGSEDAIAENNETLQTLTTAQGAQGEQLASLRSQVAQSATSLSTLQTELSTASERLAEITPQLTAQAATIGDMQETISSLQGEDEGEDASVTAELQSAISTLRSQVTALSGKLEAIRNQVQSLNDAAEND